MTPDLPIIPSSKSKKKKLTDNKVPKWTIFSLCFITTLVVVSLIKAYLPLPPGFEIKMTMVHLEGTINENSGEILLKFESKFIFSIGAKLKFPALIVNSLLKTGKVKGKLHEEEGQVLQENGKTKLVGISTIPKTGNKILDTFLGLPNEALAELQCEIK